MAGAAPGRAVQTAKLLFAVALIAPLLVFVAMLGTRFGWWDWSVGYQLLTRRAAPWAAAAGGVAALAAVLVALKDLKRAGVWAALAVVASGATLGLLLRHADQAAAAGAVWDVSTDPSDPPGFPSRLTALRAAAGAATLQAPAGPDQCPGLAPLDAQAAPEAAGWALQQAGFTVLGFGVGRADGVRDGFWYGFTHDAVVRIRPGRTDVRVTAREARPDGAEACRLAREIVAALQPAR